MGAGHLAVWVNVGEFRIIFIVRRVTIVVRAYLSTELQLVRPRVSYCRLREIRRVLAYLVGVVFVYHVRVLGDVICSRCGAFLLLIERTRCRVHVFPFKFDFLVL